MNAIINTTAVRRVKRGARWLDEHWPDWWREVDLSTLNLASSCDCVLGQLGRDYTAVANHFSLVLSEDERDLVDGFNLFEQWVMPNLGLDDVDMQNFGFEYAPWEGVTYENLQEAWADAITERRLAASVI
jgi:hypothetical protein